MPARSSFLSLVQKFFESSPATAAHSLEIMPKEEAVRVLQALPEGLAAQAVSFMESSLAGGLMVELSQDKFRKIAEKLSPEKSAAVFRSLSKEKREEFLSVLSAKNKAIIHELLSYPEDSAGRIMKTDFIALHADLKVRETIQKIRTLASRGYPASYLYVVDSENRLAGVINMRDLMLATPDASLEKIMRKDVFAVNCFMDREHVAQELSARRYFAAPVIDFENRLLGVVRADQLIDDIQDEATEDIQMMFGAGGDERPFSPVSYSLKKRLPWLCVNLGTAFLAASVVSFFEPLIAQLTVLAIFLPVIAGMGGNAGAQSLAVVMRGLVMREIPAGKAKSLILKETGIGILNGLVIGTLTGLIAFVWKGNPYLGLVVTLGMLGNLTLAGLAGAGIPMTMKRIGLDPAQCSNIILTTVTDVMGFLLFLGFALLFRAQLS